MAQPTLNRRDVIATTAGAGAAVLAAAAGDNPADAAQPVPPAAPNDVTLGKAGEPHQAKTGAERVLTTTLGVPIADDQNSLKAGQRGPVLMEDFLFRDKMMHFDHERIPERVVHARGAGAHGYFELTGSLSDISRADIFQRPGERTPVFVRFSTVAGNRGSSDMARDVRGFAVKFYTREGNWDLVGNNIPVFFIQDPIKFPDIIHAVKEEPDRGFPQAGSAHDTFWDFISLVPESMHMIMWVMSDRAIPRSLRMMDGFGVHTFRLVNGAGKSTFVKFHWRPKLGKQSVVWDEAVKISGADPDFHRRDLWNAIDQGDFPEFELAVQLFDEKFAEEFDFDVLDPTKLIPEELVPLKVIGRMVLDTNPPNVFADTEQVAFCTTHVVPGIDFSNDPLLQGRNFSYFDTQLKRLGGPNFNQIPINQPRCPMQNFQRDGHMQMSRQSGRVSYGPSALEPDTLGENPKTGFKSFAETMEGDKLRVRSESFADHFSQARQFFMSQTKPEQDHIVAALTFELSKVETEAVRGRVLAQLVNIDETLAGRVAEGLGYSGKIAAAPAAKKTRTDLKPSPALSILANWKNTIEGRVVGCLVADGADAGLIEALRKAVTKDGGKLKIIAPKIAGAVSAGGNPIAADFQLAGGPSVLFDAVAVIAGEAGAKMLEKEAAAVAFVHDAYAHLKVIGASEEAAALLKKAGAERDDGIVPLKAAAVKDYVDAVKKGRIWSREPLVRQI